MYLKRGGEARSRDRQRGDPYGGRETEAHARKERCRGKLINRDWREIHRPPSHRIGVSNVDGAVRVEKEAGTRATKGAKETEEIPAPGGGPRKVEKGADNRVSIRTLPQRNCGGSQGPASLSGGFVYTGKGGYLQEQAAEVS